MPWTPAVQPDPACVEDDLSVALQHQRRLRLRGWEGAPEPRVLEGLLCGEARLGVRREELGDEVLAGGGDGPPRLGGEAVLAALDLLEGLGIRGVQEGQLAVQHEVEHHARAPHVHGLAVSQRGLLAAHRDDVLQRLGGQVLLRAADGVHQGVSVGVLGQPKVGDLDERGVCVQ